MAIDRIAKRIMSDAEAEVNRIAKEADASIERVRTIAARAVTAIEKEAAQEAENAARDQQRRMISRVRAEMRKELLEEKQKLIDQVFGKALEAVIRLDDGSYAALMRKLLLAGAEAGDEEVIVAEPDRKRNWASILAEVNAELAGSGSAGRLVLSEETRPMAGGFVLRKGKREINCNVANLLKSLREEVESEVVKILFPKTGSTPQ